MAFFNAAVGVLQTLVVALGAGLGIWGAINLLEGYGNDNPVPTLLALYLEDTKAQTEDNISQMQKELTSAEKELFLLAEEVLEKLSSLTEEEFQKLDLFSDFPM